MDEYAEYIYKRRPSYRNLDPGDISKQVEIRQRLQCKSFKWFMENVAFDLPKVYPPVEPEDFAQGAITSAVDKSFCVDAGLGTSNQRYVCHVDYAGTSIYLAFYASTLHTFSCRIGIKKCSKSSKQKFKLTWHKDIRFHETQCFDVSVGGDFAPVNFYQCHGAQGNQLWKYEKVRQKLPISIYVHSLLNNLLSLNFLCIIDFFSSVRQIICACVQYLCTNFRQID